MLIVNRENNHFSKSNVERLAKISCLFECRRANNRVTRDGLEYTQYRVASCVYARGKKTNTEGRRTLPFNLL